MLALSCTFHSFATESSWTVFAGKFLTSIHRQDNVTWLAVECLHNLNSVYGFTQTGAHIGWLLTTVYHKANHIFAINASRQLVLQPPVKEALPCLFLMWSRFLNQSDWLTFLTHWISYKLLLKEKFKTEVQKQKCVVFTALISQDKVPPPPHPPTPPVPLLINAKLTGCWR